MTGILSLGLHPSVLDYSRHPDLDEATLTARIAAGEAALRAAGFDIVPCLVDTDPTEAAAAIRACVAAHPVRVVMIGAGVRIFTEHTLLFEQVVNLLVELVPDVVFCFNTSPETTIDAIRRGTRTAAEADQDRTAP
ncbi:hypothetical protein FHR81_003804 [Actinoalloteichus hoggarensis]|uniref:Uncharacterized protein n=1 Tax=Actinoalloteichus hoggarensis TaxID=1470176 RepID=A0A221WBY6_9PSEU|nr:hypothetical protein [Actinoalloteichus hoggarensis]ASO23143.1 hypothetical protein AHOG_27730 [Actinoalloteichus hoggarensis]MBB5922747.1 hypothetical protein [Actinoalloteichus hoggarensis]